MRKNQRNENELKTIIKIEIAIAVASFPIFLIGGIFTNLAVAMILYLLIPAFETGVHGGIWLWDYLATSNLFEKGFPPVVKVLAGFFLVSLLIFLIIGFSQSFIAPVSFMLIVVDMITSTLWFMLFYFLGYIITIWVPNDSSESEQASQLSIEWKKSLILLGIFAVILLTSLIIALPIVILLVFPPELIFRIVFTIFSGELGFILAVLVWMHVRKTNLLQGQFLQKLKLFSIGSLIPIPILIAGGMISLVLGSPVLLQIELLSVNLFLFWMFSYFVGLFYALLKKERKS